MTEIEIIEEIRSELKSFYSVLKSSDSYLHFVFLTGVTKFSKVTIFSDLNQLMDISLDDQYSSICGISQTELEKHFKQEIAELAIANKLSYEETLNKLRRKYDGYHFSAYSEDLYNPFGLLNTFNSKVFRNYWYATGTPTFLVKMLMEKEFDIKSLEEGVAVSVDTIFEYRADQKDPIPLLYQSGYLTIKNYDAEENKYTLGFPNDEVKYGFYEELIPVYMPEKSYSTTFFAASFIEYLKTDNIEGFMKHLQAFFADIPNVLNNKTEKHYQTIFYVLFRLMGQFVQVEVNSSIGRADAIIETKNSVCAFEFKITEQATAEEALKQIDERGYLNPYATSGKKMFKVGVEFDNKRRGISRWIIE
jgi:hypothetical protein